MAVDKQGLSLTGSKEAAAAYDRAIDHLIRFQPQVTDVAAESVAADPGCVMGRVLGAYLGLMSTEEGGVAAARAALGRPAAGTVLCCRASVLTWQRLNTGSPVTWLERARSSATFRCDTRGTCSPSGWATRSISSPATPSISETGSAGRSARGAAGIPNPDSWHGMYAFGLEECNQYGHAAEAGQRAVETNPDDVWGIHAVVHTYEMQGQIPDGVRFMRVHRENWSADNFLNVHNSWHYALYLLQANDIAGALAVYDSFLHHSGSEDVALELLDATALLWRLQLEGSSVGNRWPPLAAAWARLLAPGFYPFNDMHAIMAFIGAGEPGRAQEVVTALERVVREGNPAATGWAMTSIVGLPVCRSLVHFGTGQYEQVLDDLMPIRTRIHEFGGSHAQRDAVERTLLEAAIRARREDLANALVSERLAVRECSTYAWSKRAVLLATAGDQAAAASAAARASELAAQISAAAATAPGQPG